MKNVFPKQHYECAKCGMPVSGEYKVDGQYLCEVDAEINSKEEKSYNTVFSKRRKFFKKMFS